METGEAWRSLFETWPELIPRKGLVVTTFQESIPFTNFMISGGLLLIERDQPDSYGARKVILGYDAISALKITAPTDLSHFQVMGFQSTL
jgi:hypothetical protein